ncbi:hypothetical protein [Piscirickettsia litoralis]|uniref:Butyrate kinase n=1 Tax=Piscirickettsia litoralis TaxID=1891921 RepID=A0ABX2ZYZ8_9GAMM|nr:hypothetical protein [Piscirickettsia litoralis]ODN41851.1 hypothetical protein BGC07_01260 [Piscirickettsia litoralis]
MLKTILTLNAGSSSLKFSVYQLICCETRPDLQRKLSGQVRGLGSDPLSLEMQYLLEGQSKSDADRKMIYLQPEDDPYALALEEVLSLLKKARYYSRYCWASGCSWRRFI